MRAVRMAAALVAASIVVACAPHGTSSLPALTANGVSVAPSASAGFLYVGNENASVTVYPAGGTTPLRTLKQGIANVYAMAVDAAGDLYIANGGTTLGSVTEYGRGGTRVLRTIAKLDAKAVTLDKNDNLYVADDACPYQQACRVLVYEHGGAKLVRTLSFGQYSVTALVCDHAGYLYVGVADKGVVVFAPRSDKPLTTIRRVGAQSLAVDRSNNLYVGTNASNVGNVKVFAPKGGKMLREILNISPLAMAVDPSQRLYVASYTSAGYGGAVRVFKPDSTALAYRIEKRVNWPVGLAFDEKGNLYVPDHSVRAVTVYGAGTANLLRTIERGVDHPTAIAYGR